ncbi:SDR family NAD(P)-dependent oxidoreductase, partial [Acinetobacter baumannii]
GYRVIVASRRAPEMERLAASLTASGINATARAIDAVHPANVHSSISALGPIDVLIYNAACLTMSVPTALSPEQLSADLNVSVVSALAAARVV